MSTNHIIFFTQLYYPDMTTTATLMTDLVEDLACNGMHPEVVCAQPTYVKNLDPHPRGIAFGFHGAGITPVPSPGATPVPSAGATPIQSFLLTGQAPVPSAGATGQAGQAGHAGQGNLGIRGSVNSGKFPKVELRNDVSIRRVWTFLFDKNKNIGRILNSTSCFFSMLPRLLSSRNNSLMVFNTNPALLSLLGLINAKLRSQRYVVLVHDLWPELPAHIGMIKNNGVLFRAIEFANKLAFKHASATVVLSGAMKKRVLDKVPETNGSVHVIHNWVDADRVYPVAKADNRILKELGLQDKKVIMYSGNPGRYQPLEVMIGAANELRNRKDMVFVFAGDGGKDKRFRRWQLP